MEFYAELESWDCCFDDHDSIIKDTELLTVDCKCTSEECDGVYSKNVGGKKARQALEKLKEIRKTK